MSEIPKEESKIFISEEDKQSIDRLSKSQYLDYIVEGKAEDAVDSYIQRRNYLFYTVFSILIALGGYLGYEIFSVQSMINEYREELSQIDSVFEKVNRLSEIYELRIDILKSSIESSDKVIEERSKLIFREEQFNQSQSAQAKEYYRYLNQKAGDLQRIDAALAASLSRSEEWDALLKNKVAELNAAVAALSESAITNDIKVLDGRVEGIEYEIQSQFFTIKKGKENADENGYDPVKVKASISSAEFTFVFFGNQNGTFLKLISPDNSEKPIKINQEFDESMVLETFEYGDFKYELSEESSMQIYKSALAQFFSIDSKKIKGTLMLKLKTKRKLNT